MRANDLTGKRFGKLVAIKKVEGGSSRWLCQCDCGNEKVIYATNLMNGQSKSCGCSKTVHGDAGTKLYHVHMNMCRQEICDDWQDYKVFKEWAMNNGYQEGVRIVRIDPGKPFSPDNCEIKVKNVQVT